MEKCVKMCIYEKCAKMCIFEKMRENMYLWKKWLLEIYQLKVLTFTGSAERPNSQVFIHDFTILKGIQCHQILDASL